MEAGCAAPAIMAGSRISEVLPSIFTVESSTLVNRASPTIVFAELKPSIQRFMEATTSSAFISLPSWNFTPFLSVKVSVLPSFVASYFSASSGTASALEFNVTSFSQTVPSQICLAIRELFLCKSKEGACCVTAMCSVSLYVAFSGAEAGPDPVELCVPEDPEQAVSDIAAARTKARNRLSFFDFM